MVRIWIPAFAGMTEVFDRIILLTVMHICHLEQSREISPPSLRLIGGLKSRVDSGESYHPTEL